MTAATNGETLTRSRSRSSDHNERLEPQLLRAAENDNVDLLRQIIEVARVRKQFSDSFLRIALMRSAEKGKVNATQFLLDQKAPPDGIPGGNRPSPLMRAVERNNIAIVQLLLSYDADRDSPDKKGRTALMTAAWKNHWHILNLLLVRGANVNKKDLRGRNVLHNLAADKQCDWGDEVITLLLNSSIRIDGPEGQDHLCRTPLHWACATGKIHLAEQLLTRAKGPKADINALEIREKTCLHLASAHGREDIVQMLLHHGANVNAKSDGGWTPLHNASEIGSQTIVPVLLAAGADVTAKLLNGMTPLHLAAQGGHLQVVEFLLAKKEIKRAARDSFGSTPFLRAAQNKRRDIVNLLAPFNNLEALSEDALGACNGFNATIVDFGNFHNENRVVRRTVFELLYARDTINPRKPAVTIKPQEKATNFRWVHLPANNMAWVEALLTKSFIEEGASDVEGFKALERSFSHQHGGQRVHSHFMRPLCQSTPKAPIPRVPEDETQDSSTEQGPPVIIINGGGESRIKTPVKRSASGEDVAHWFNSSTQHSGKENERNKHKEKERGKKHEKGGKSPKIGTETPTKDQRKPSQPSGSWHVRTASSPGRKDIVPHPKGNIFVYLPYLHFETRRKLQEMQAAILQAEALKTPARHYITRARTCDEQLIRAHLNTSTVSLHVRRTLDQSFYHNIDTRSRDDDQVVYRYQTKGRDPEDASCDPKIVMVDQLWMWILGKDLIVTSFPQRWQQPKNDPLNVLDSVIEDINSKTREPVTSVYDLAMIITSRCSGVFDRHRMGDEDYQFLDMFESSIGNATDRETLLFKEFNVASAQASAWLQYHRRPGRFSRLIEDIDIKEERQRREDRLKVEDFVRGPLFVDKLLDIGQETDLLAETKDIRDELNMIAKVLDDQSQVLSDLEAAICDIYLGEQKSQQEVKKRFKEQLKIIDMHIKDIERMDKQAERIYDSITDMLDLKQKHANAFEARFARDQAAGTARQSQTIMVFTIVTIVFLPLSFIASFFAINVADFPRSGANGGLPLGYVSRYMFGIGFAVSIPLIVIALVLDDVGKLVKVGRRWIAQRWRGRRGSGSGGRGTVRISEESEDLKALDLFRIEQALGAARSVRMSAETEWDNPHVPGLGMGAGRARLSRDAAMGQQREVLRAPLQRRETGFRMRPSQDVERGVRTRVERG